MAHHLKQSPESQQKSVFVLIMSLGQAIKYLSLSVPFLLTSFSVGTQLSSLLLLQRIQKKIWSKEYQLANLYLYKSLTTALAKFPDRNLSTVEYLCQVNILCAFRRYGKVTYLFPKKSGRLWFRNREHNS